MGFSKEAEASAKITDVSRQLGISVPVLSLRACARWSAHNSLRGANSLRLNSHCFQFGVLSPKQKQLRIPC